MLTTLLRAAKGTVVHPSLTPPLFLSAVQSPWLPECRAGTGVAQFGFVFFEPGLVLSFFNVTKAICRVFSNGPNF